ncbi:MAG: fibronectin type III domain-containing protein [Acidobacteriota bacterium]|nr:fibronectin type III domain-containing protein [Acidobacteriota bacterium]
MHPCQGAKPPKTVKHGLASPSGVAMDGTGNLYVADSGNQRIRVLRRSSSPSSPQAPTQLRATPVSPSRIDLTWQDNSTNETGFRVQRRLAGSADWVPIGTTAANGTKFSDRGASPDTLYRYRVQAFNDTGSSAFSNETEARTPATPTRGISSRLFVPVILTASGRNNSFFTSELTLTNRGNQTATLRHTYTAAAGGGGGAASETLGAGRQKIAANAIDYLRALGISIPAAGNRIGTLRVEASGTDVTVTVRTTTRMADGRAGLAYPGIAVADGFEEAVYLCGLRQNAQDRSNVAFQNMGTSQEGNITLRTTVFSGDPFANPRSRVLPDVTLDPGGFHQYSGLLGTAGIEQGYVRVERVRGDAPFYAYGVINDLTGVVIGARTGSPGGGGQYSVFYNAVPYGAAFDDTAWVDALQQNRETRSNLALVNTGEVDGSDSVFRLEIYDGDTGRRVNTVTGIRVPARGWHQINGILGNYAPGTT